jgi:hypothetical protein
MKDFLFGDGTAVTRGEFGQSLRHRKHKNTCDEKVTKPVIFMACSQGGWHGARAESDSPQRVSHQRFKAQNGPFEPDC